MARPFAARAAAVEAAYKAGEINEHQKRAVDVNDANVARDYIQRAQQQANDQLAEVRQHNSTAESRYREIEQRLAALKREATTADDANRLRDLRKELQTLHREELNLDRLCEQYAELEQSATWIRDNPIAFWDELIDKSGANVAEGISPNFTGNWLEAYVDRRRGIGDPNVPQTEFKKVNPKAATRGYAGHHR